MSQLVEGQVHGSQYGRCGQCWQSRSTMLALIQRVRDLLGPCSDGGLDTDCASTVFT